MIRTDMTMEDYLQHPGVSSSRLKLMLKTPADFRAASTESFTDTKATVFGTAAHVAILEPHLFEQRYALQPEDWGPRNKGSGHAKWKEFKQENDGKICLGFADTVALDKIRKSAKDHEALQEVLSQAEDFEVTALHDVGKFFLKSRTDIKCKTEVWDAKTTSKGVDDESIARTIFQMGYHFQAAHHMHVLNAAGCEITSFGWVFIDTESPATHIRLVRATPELLAAGKQDFEFALHRLHAAIDEDRWPGYENSIGTVGLPAYAERYYE